MSRVKELEVDWRLARSILRSDLNLENSSQSVVEIDEAVRGNKLAEYSLKTLRIQYARYEFVRTLTPRLYKDLWERQASGGGRFDDLVDAAIIDRKDWIK
jgi:hypothetical protein